MRFLCATAMVAAVVYASEASMSSGLERQRPNFIVIQPDDHLFLEEWNPPARFENQNNMYPLDTSTFPPSSFTSTSPSSKYISPVPNINRIRDHGLEMKNAYAASTMCGTSRYSTLTGRLPSRSSYGRYLDRAIIERSILDGEESTLIQRDVIIPKTKLEDVLGIEDSNDCTSNNLAAVLQQHGYFTGVVGKWHLGVRDTSSGESLYDNYENVQEDVRLCGFDFAEAIYRENLGGARNVNVNGDPVTHNMEHVTAEAIRFIQQAVNASRTEMNDGGDEEEGEATGASNDNSHSSQPFFLYFNPTVPHSSGDVTDALLEANCKDTVQGKLSEEPFIPYGMTAAFDGMGDARCRKYRKTVIERSAAVSDALKESGEPVDDDKLAGAVWVDDAIGSLFQTLEALEILDNTLVLFQLDHGLDAKGSVFEGASRIVQFIHYPDGIKVDGSNGGKTPTQQHERRGWEFDGLVSTIDIAPTIMDLAGVPLAPSKASGADHGKDSIDGNHTEESPAPLRYEMDGKSWFSDVVAANTDVDKGSTSFGQREQAYDYFKERCLFVEHDLDRSVRCGCYKYIYVPDLTRGKTVQIAQQQGANLDTHNFYYLCDESTGNYINSPERSPELWPFPFDSSVANSSHISDHLKTKLKNKITCLLEKTNPMDEHIDYETDCGLPLDEDELEGSKIPNTPSSTGTIHSPTQNASGVVSPSISPSSASPVSSEPNQPISLDYTVSSDGSEPERKGEGSTPFRRPASSSSTASLIEDSTLNYVIVAASLTIAVASFLLCFFCRRIRRMAVARKGENDSQSKASRDEPEETLEIAAIGDSTTDSMEMIERENTVQAVTANDTPVIDLEAGQTMHKNGFSISKGIESDFFVPTIWQKLADETKRRASLRAKLKTYSVTGVIITSSSSTLGTVLSSESIESENSTPCDMSHQSAEEKEIGEEEEANEKEDHEEEKEKESKEGEPKEEKEVCEKDREEEDCELDSKDNGDTTSIVETDEIQKEIPKSEESKDADEKQMLTNEEEANEDEDEDEPEEGDNQDETPSEGMSEKLKIEVVLHTEDESENGSECDSEDEVEDENEDMDGESSADEKNEKSSEDDNDTSNSH